MRRLMTFLVAGSFLSLPALAEPYAPWIMKGSRAKMPEASTVAIPAYPGAKAMAVMNRNREPAATARLRGHDRPVEPVTRHIA